MKVTRYFNVSKYKRITYNFPEWELDFEQTNSLLMDINKKYQILKFNPECLLPYKKIKFQNYIISGKLLSSVLKWCVNNF